jgi:BMFP domain-containing protein YqiC
MPKPTPPNLDEMVDQVLNALPQGLRDLTRDAETNLRAALHSGLAKMGLVTREEFDIQRSVLARSRARLEVLEQQVKKLESELQQQGEVTGKPGVQDRE